MITIKKKTLALDEIETAILASCMYEEILENEATYLLDAIGDEKISALSDKFNELDCKVQDATREEKRQTVISLFNKLLFNLDIK